MQCKQVSKILDSSSSVFWRWKVRLWTPVYVPWKNMFLLLGLSFLICQMMGLDQTDLENEKALLLFNVFNIKNISPPKNLWGTPVCKINWEVSALVEERAREPRLHQVYRTQCKNSCSRCSWKSMPSLTFYSFRFCLSPDSRTSGGIYGQWWVEKSSIQQILSVFCILGTMSHETVGEQHEKKHEDSKIESDGFPEPFSQDFFHCHYTQSHLLQ